MSIRRAEVAERTFPLAACGLNIATESMKSQYFGDVRDFAKYGVLRAMRSAGLSLAVLWWLTEDDRSGDGRLLEYLDDERLRRHDPELFDGLRRWFGEGAVRSVAWIENSGLLDGATFYGRVVPREGVARRRWLDDGLRVARGADVVFLDPDNGLEVKSVRPGTVQSAKYVFLDELARIHATGASVLIYQHHAHVAYEEIVSKCVDALSGAIESPKLVVLRATGVSFFLIPQARHSGKLARAIAWIEERWAGSIAVHSVDGPATHAAQRTHPPTATPRVRVSESRLRTAPTTVPGFTNPNGQVVLRATGLPGTDHRQKIYVLACRDCSLEYGANGSDIHGRKCPACQKGAPGLAINQV